MTGFRYWLQLGRQVRHVASGECYEVVGFADFQCSTTRQHDNATLVLYQKLPVRSDRPPEARLIDEFCDGRFEMVKEG